MEGPRGAGTFTAVCSQSRGSHPPRPAPNVTLRNVYELCFGEVGSLFQNDKMSQCLIYLLSRTFTGPRALWGFVAGRSRGVSV